MKVLGLEASGIVASVAIAKDDKLIAEYTINHKRTHSKTLMPMLDEMNNRLETELESIDAIAVAAGPGSYTGLRISSSTAKGLAMALDKPIISVPTMEALAFNMWGVKSLVCPIVDARRSQVYTGIYYFEDERICELMPQTVLLIEDLISSVWEMCNQRDKEYSDVIFLGDACPAHHDLIVEKLGKKASFAPAHMNMPRAASVATLGVQYALRKEMESAREHRPIYLMLSEAEKERVDAGKDILEPSTNI